MAGNRVVQNRLYIPTVWWLTQGTGDCGSCAWDAEHSRVRLNTSSWRRVGLGPRPSVPRTCCHWDLPLYQWSTEFNERPTRRWIGHFGDAAFLSHGSRLARTENVPPVKSGANPALIQHRPVAVTVRLSFHLNLILASYRGRVGPCRSIKGPSSCRAVVISAPVSLPLP